MSVLYDISCKIASKRDRKLRKLQRKLMLLVCVSQYGCLSIRTTKV